MKAREQLIAWARTALPAVVSTLGLSGLVSVLGAAVVWSRFNAAGLPANQAVADQPAGSLIVVGAASLAIYLILGLLAALVVYLLQGVVLSNEILGTPTSRYADPVRRLEREQRLVKARTVELGDAVKGAKESEPDGARLKDLQQALGVAAQQADEIGRKLFEAKAESLDVRRSGNAWGLLMVAAVELIVVVIRTKVPGSEKLILGAVALMMAALAVAAACVRDRGLIAVLAGMAVVLLALLVALVAVGSWTLAPIATALLLMLICIAVGRLHPRRFFWLGITVFTSVALFGAVLTYSRDQHAPSAQAAAILLKNGCAVEGLWVGETGDRVFLARVSPDEPSSEGGQQLAERNQPDAGRVFSLDRSQVVSESIGKLRRVPYASRQAAAMRAELLAIQGESVLSNTACTATGQASDYFAGQMSSFRGAATLHAGPLSAQLCVVRYFSRERAKGNNSDPGANWWTTCQYNSRLRSMALVRSKLALPKTWGVRDARVVATIPAGTNITYLSGLAAEQCEIAPTHQCYGGGGIQLLFHDRDVNRNWFQSTECTSSRETAPARFVPCRL